MRLYLRMFLIILSAFRRKKNLPIRGESKITLIVLPWDCVVQYVGNDRYHAFLDLARTDLSIRLGWLPLILHQKWKPQVISCHIRHLGPLHLFDRFTVTSYIIETTSKYIWMAHRIECNGKVVCTAVSKLVAVSPRGVASLFLLPERGNFTHHFTQAAVNLLAQADAIIRNV